MKTRLIQAERQVASSLYEQMASGVVELEDIAYEVIALRSEVESLRAFKRSVEEK